MTLEQYNKMLTEKILAYQNQLKNKRKSFKIFTENHLCDSNYEDNAINDLLVIKEIRAKLEELRFQKGLVEREVIESRIRKEE